MHKRLMPRQRDFVFPSLTAEGRVPLSPAVFVAVASATAQSAIKRSQNYKDSGGAEVSGWKSLPCFGSALWGQADKPHGRPRNVRSNRRGHQSRKQWQPEGSATSDANSGTSFGWKRCSAKWIYEHWDSILITGCNVHGPSRKRNQPYLSHRPCCEANR